MAGIVDLFGNKPVPNPPPGRRQFNPYAAGNKTYNGFGTAPNVGPVSGNGMAGYAQRDNEANARKQAIMKRMKGQNTGNPMTPSVMGWGSIGAP